MYDPAFDCEVLDLFRQAVEKGRVGMAGQAIGLLEEAARTVREKGGDDKACAEFQSKTHLAIAVGLLKLGKPGDAVERLQEVAPLAGRVGSESRFSYLVTLGNAYGFLGRVGEMEWCLKSAIALAVSELDDPRRAAGCWKHLSRHAIRAKAWDSHASRARAAARFARKHRLVELGRFAEAQLQVAYRAGASHAGPGRAGPAWWSHVLSWIA